MCGAPRRSRPTSTAGTPAYAKASAAHALARAKRVQNYKCHHQWFQSRDDGFEQSCGEASRLLAQQPCMWDEYHYVNLIKSEIESGISNLSECDFS